MNKLLRALVAILAGFNAIFLIATPILLSNLIIAVFSFKGYGSYLLTSAGILATLFRAIKIGWMN